MKSLVCSLLIFTSLSAFGFGNTDIGSMQDLPNPNGMMAASQLGINQFVAGQLQDAAKCSYLERGQGELNSDRVIRDRPLGEEISKGKARQQFQVVSIVEGGWVEVKMLNGNQGWVSALGVDICM